MKREEYTTKNLQLASYLYASNIHYNGATRINGVFFFKFTSKEEAEELVNKYFSDTATVNPKTLFSKLNELKDLIFSGGAI